MKRATIAIRLAAWVLEKGGACPVGEGRKRVTVGLKTDLTPRIKGGTVVEIECPICKLDFRYTVPHDNAPPRLYCSPRCSKRASGIRAKEVGVPYCHSPYKNQYPDQKSAMAVLNTMTGEDVWKCNVYPCPAGHWHIGRVRGRIVSEGR